MMITSRWGILVADHFALSYQYLFRLSVSMIQSGMAFSVEAIKDSYYHWRAQHLLHG
jgi:hypothetical protein